MTILEDALSFQASNSREHANQVLCLISSCHTQKGVRKPRAFELFGVVIGDVGVAITVFRMFKRWPACKF
jgi:hypothetical protein